MLHVLRPEAWSGDPRSLPEELFAYVKGVFLHYDFGLSWETQHATVAERLNEGLPADISLLIGGLVIGIFAGMAGGAVCATKPGSPVARVLEVAAAFFLCAP